MLANVQEVRFPVKGDSSGRLIVQEASSDLVPVFWPRRLENMSKARNNHAKEVG